VILAVLPRLPALDTSVLLLVQPMLTVVWGRLLFAEVLSPLQVAGVALVVLGVATLAVRSARRRAVAAADS
jgi:drug/metabolite transporter (DMT)-like permease